MGAIDRLIFNRGIPPAIKQKHISRKLQVQSDRPSTVTHQKNMSIRILFEPCQNRFPLLGRNTPVVNQCTVLFHRFCKPVDDFGPLTEKYGLPSTGGDFFHVGFKTIEFGTFARQRVKIRDLLQSKHKFENMLNRNRIPKIIQLNHTFFFGHFVRRFLRGKQFQIGVAVESRWHVLHHKIFGATKNELFRQGLKLPQVGRGVGRDHFQKFIKSTQLFRPILDGCSCQSPTSTTRQRAGCYRSPGRTVFDSLSFIQHDQIKLRKLPFTKCGEVSNQRFVVGNQHWDSRHRPG